MLVDTTENHCGFFLLLVQVLVQYGRKMSTPIMSELQLCQDVSGFSDGTLWSSVTGKVGGKNSGPGDLYTFRSGSSQSEVTFWRRDVTSNAFCQNPWLSYFWVATYWYENSCEQKIKINKKCLSLEYLAPGELPKSIVIAALLIGTNTRKGTSVRMLGLGEYRIISRAERVRGQYKLQLCHFVETWIGVWSIRRQVLIGDALCIGTGF